MQITRLKAKENQMAVVEFAKACTLLAIILIGSIAGILISASRPHVSPSNAEVSSLSTELSMHIPPNSESSSKLQPQAAEADLANDMSPEIEAAPHIDTAVVGTDPHVLVDDGNDVEPATRVSGFKSGEDYWRDDPIDVAASKPVSVTINDPSVWR